MKSNSSQRHNGNNDGMKRHEDRTSNQRNDQHRNTDEGNRSDKHQ